MPSDLVDRLRGVKSSQAIKVPCRVATTANIALSGEQTIDGVAVVEGDRVLVKNQSTASENGIYEVKTSTWRRAPDWDGVGDVTTGTRVYVTAGSTNKGEWVVTTTGTITIGTTSVAFAGGTFDKNIDTSDDITEGSTKLFVRALGVAPTLSTDLTSAINAAFAAVSSGAIVIPPGDYRVDGKIIIANKSDANNSSQSNLEILAFGARFINSVAVAGDVVLELDDCKYLRIHGLEVKAANGAKVLFDGFWTGELSHVKTGGLIWSFGEANYDTFESHYWSKFTRCDLLAIELHTGTTGGDRTEFNSDIFDTCRIGPRSELSETGAAYALSIYGTHGPQSITFLNCDLSYYTTGLIYVDQTITNASHVTFIGGYLDTGLIGMDADAKNLAVNCYHVHAPNSLSLDASRLIPASKQHLDFYAGAHNGSRHPTSSFNLVKNGDLRDGSTDITLSSGGAGITATPTSGNHGLFRQHVNIVTAASRTATFTTIPVPFDGHYAWTVVIRNNGDALRAVFTVNGTDTTFDAITIPSDGEWTIASFTNLNSVAAGDVLAMRIFAASTTNLDYDIAYVGCTYGRIGQLYAPLHPLAGSLQIPDSAKDHRLSVASGTDLSANRTLTLTTGDADRTLDISAANVTISSAAATVLDDASVRAMCATLGTPYRLGSSAVKVSHTGDTNETTLVTINVPAGAMGANGFLMITWHASATNNANTKTWRWKLGGTTLRSVANASSLNLREQFNIHNRNSASSQIAGGPNSSMISGFGTTTGAWITGSVDTSAAVDLVLTGQLATGTDEIAIESYSVFLVYVA